MRKKKSWGDIYYRWLRKGVDHGYAAYMADQWLKRCNSGGNRRKTMKPITDKQMHRTDCMYYRGAPITSCNCFALSKMPKLDIIKRHRVVAYLYKR